MTRDSNSDTIPWQYTVPSVDRVYIKDSRSMAEGLPDSGGLKSSTGEGLKAPREVGS